MLNKGFNHIRAFAKDKRDTRIENRALSKVRRMFWHKICGSAFSLWRENSHFQTVALTEATIYQTTCTLNAHDRRYK